MYAEIKQIFFDASVQQQISNTVSYTTQLAFRLAYQNENITEAEFIKKRDNLNGKV